MSDQGTRGDASLSRVTGRRRFMIAGGTVGAAGLSGCISNAINAGSSYPSKDVTFITGGAGSLFDFWARGAKQFMDPKLPDDVNVVVQNVPGGGGTTAGDRIYTADADGYTIGNYNVPGNLAGQLVLDTKYNLEKVSWVGRLAKYPYVLFVNPDSEFSSLDDLRNANRELKFSVVGLGSTGSLTTVIGNKVLGIDNYSMVTGYQSGIAALQAVTKGDVDARFQIGPVVTDQIKANDVEPLLVLDDESASYAPNVPTASDIGAQALTKFALQVFVGGPPEIESGRIETLRTTLQEATGSEEMQQWAEENAPLGRGFNPADASTCSDLIGQFQNDIEEYRDELESRFSQ